MSKPRTHSNNNARFWLLLIFLTVLLLMGASLKVLAFSGSRPTNAGPVVLMDDQGKYELGLHLQILEDPGGKLTIEDVSSPAFQSQFIPSQVPVPIYGYTDSVYWLSVDLTNRTSINQWFLETYFQNLNYVDLYLPAEGGGFTEKQSGALRPFATRDIPYYHVVFKIPLAAQDEEIIYIRVKSGSSMTLQFILWSPEAFAANKLIDMLLIGLFYGSMLMVLGYHIFLLFSLRDISYFYFILFLASAILFFASYQGVADQFLWPAFTEEKKYILVITMSLFFITALKFSDVFLNQKVRSPRLHVITYIFIGYWALMIAILPFFSFGFMAQITGLGVLITPAFAAFCGFYHWRTASDPARFYLISWLGFMLGIILAELVRDGTIPSTPITENFYQIGLLWLVLLWSLALANRINILKAQTERANKSLRDSEHELTQILDGVPLAVVVYGKDEIPRYANKRAAEILSNPEQGIRPSLSSRRTLKQALEYFSIHVAGTKQKYPVDQLPVYRALQGESSSVDDMEANLVDRLVPIEMWASPITDDAGNIVSAVAAYQDITQRKHTEAELEEYRKMLEALVEKRTADISAINDWLNTINDVHQTLGGVKDIPQVYKKLSAAIARQLTARTVFLVHWGDNVEHVEVYSDSEEQVSVPSQVISRLKSAVVRTREFYGEGITGKPIVLNDDQKPNFSILLEEYLKAEEQKLFVVVPMVSQQKVDGLLGIVFRDPQAEISHQQSVLMEKMALDLVTLTRNALLLDQSIELATVEERQRIARDLHDSVNQMLFSASLFSSILPQRIRRNPESAIEATYELHRLTRGALAEMRTLLLELRPTGITKVPLGELLQQLVEAMSGRGDFSLELDVMEIPPLPDDVQVVFYRIAQEALNNVFKHASAKHVVLRLSTSPTYPSDTLEEWRGTVQLLVKDDGIGFEPDTLAFQHFGLGIMQERAAAIQAEFRLASSPGHGTEISLIWRL